MTIKGKGRRLTALLLAVLTLSVAVVFCMPASFADEAPETAEESARVAPVSEPEDPAPAPAPAVGTDSGRFEKSNYPKLPENASLGDRVVYGLKVVGIGMGIVFLVLIILMAVLYVFKLVAASKAKQTKPVAKDPAVSQTNTAPATDAGDGEENIVAIATAAIAASRGESDCAFRVISITKLS